MQARLRFSNEVHQADVTEALRLTYASKASLLEHKLERENPKDPIDEIFKIFQQLEQSSKRGSIRFEAVAHQLAHALRDPIHSWLNATICAALRKACAAPC